MSKAIVTKYHGPTNTRGARISATDGDNRISISYPHDLNNENAHKAAAEALKTKLKWGGRMIAGGTKTGFVFVFEPVSTECTRAALVTLLAAVQPLIAGKRDGATMGNISNAADIALESLAG